MGDLFPHVCPGRFGLQPDGVTFSSFEVSVASLLGNMGDLFSAICSCRFDLQPNGVTFPFFDASVASLLET